MSSTPPDTPEMIEPGRWRMWALPTADGQFTDPGDRRYSREFSQTVSPVPVLVTEDPDGPYWGWLWSHREIPDMIYPTETQYRICFAYGPEAEQEHGNGRMLRLQITPFP